MNIYTLLHKKQIVNKDLLYAQELYMQYSVITYKRGESGKEMNMFTCLRESLCCMPEATVTL